MGSVSHVVVTPEEAGQKLLQFLQRRLGRDVPTSLLMRLIRKGQVRVDSKRRKPFDRIEAGQTVRIPPINLATAPQGVQSIDPALELCVVHQGSDFMVIAKPVGLPVQPGTGHTDAVSERLRLQFAQAAFTPTPAHRLDRDTSGLLLVGTSYEGLRRLQQGFKDHSLGKYYLAWVHGSLKEGQILEMHDLVQKQGEAGDQRVHTGQGKDALATARCLRTKGRYSLLEVELHTGRTHQIRVQLASRGFPLVGDHKYGKRDESRQLMLHAGKVILPEGQCLELAPDWTGPWAV